MKSIRAAVLVYLLAICATSYAQLNLCSESLSAQPQQDMILQTVHENISGDWQTSKSELSREVRLGLSGSARLTVSSRGNGVVYVTMENWTSNPYLRAARTLGHKLGLSNHPELTEANLIRKKFRQANLENPSVNNDDPYSLRHRNNAFTYEVPYRDGKKFGMRAHFVIEHEEDVQFLIRYVSSLSESFNPSFHASLGWRVSGRTRPDYDVIYEPGTPDQERVKDHKTYVSSIFGALSLDMESRLREFLIRNSQSFRLINEASDPHGLRIEANLYSAQAETPEKIVLHYTEDGQIHVTSRELAGRLNLETSEFKSSEVEAFFKDLQTKGWTLGPPRP